jgi:hypothetical protein
VGEILKMKKILGILLAVYFLTLVTAAVSTREMGVMNGETKITDGKAITILSCQDDTIFWRSKGEDSNKESCTGAQL